MRPSGNEGHRERRNDRIEVTDAIDRENESREIRSFKYSKADAMSTEKLFALGGGGMCEPRKGLAAGCWPLWGCVGVS